MLAYEEPAPAIYERLYDHKTYVLDTPLLNSILLFQPNPPFLCVMTATRYSSHQTKETSLCTITFLAYTLSSYAKTATSRLAIPSNDIFLLSVRHLMHRLWWRDAKLYMK